MKDKLKPLIWGLATAGTAYLLYIGTGKYIADNSFLRELPLAVKQPRIDFVVNSAMSYGTLRSIFDNWIPSIYLGRTREVRRMLDIAKSKKATLAAGVSLGLILTFPASINNVVKPASDLGYFVWRTSSDVGYLVRKASKGEFLQGVHTLYIRATCFEKAKSLDEIVRDHGHFHKEVLENEKYRNPKLPKPVKEALDPRFLIAVESKESNGRWCEVGQPPYYEEGPMQLTGDIAKRYKVKDTFNVRESIMGGGSYLADLVIEHKGNPRFAASAYNAGENIQSQRARNYARDVLELYVALQIRYEKDLTRKEQIQRPPKQVPPKPATPRKRAMLPFEFQTGYMPAYISRNHSYQRA